MSFFKKPSHSYTSLISMCKLFKILWVIISWVWVIHKSLNVNWKKIHSIILSVTCHSLRNLPHSYTLPISIHKYLKLYELSFLEFESFIESWMWFEKNIHSNNFICHWSLLKKPVPHSYTSPCIHLWIFKTLWVIISWVWVIHKRLNVNWKKIHSIILSVTCHSLRNLPPLIHIASYPFMNFQNPMSYYFLSLSHS